MRSGGAHLPRYNELGLEREMLARIEVQGFSHPWLSAPAEALPGKTVHVAFLMRAQNSLELYPRRSAPPHIAPLLSQPIVELCLSIPTCYSDLALDSRRTRPRRRPSRLLEPAPKYDH